MASHSSATPREETSDITKASPKTNASPKFNASSKINNSSKIDAAPKIEGSPKSQGSVKSEGSSKIIDASLKRRARLLVTNSSIPRQTRSLIQYALQIKDPYLAQVVRRVEAGEMVINCLYVE